MLPSIALDPAVCVERVGRSWPVKSNAEGCHIWQQAIQPNGYARTKVAGGRTAVPAHRVAWVAFHGRDVAPGLVIDHLCETKNCVNPVHLRETTYRGNILRSDTPAARNAAKRCCPRGHLYDAINSQGRRTCRTCDRDRMRRNRAAAAIVRTEA